MSGGDLGGGQAACQLLGHKYGLLRLHSKQHTSTSSLQKNTPSIVQLKLRLRQQQVAANLHPGNCFTRIYSSQHFWACQVTSKTSILLSQHTAQCVYSACLDGAQTHHGYSHHVDMT